MEKKDEKSLRGNNNKELKDFVREQFDEIRRKKLQFPVSLYQL